MLSHSPGSGLARKHAVTAVFDVETARTVVVSSRMFAMFGDIVGANCVVRYLARCSFTMCATGSAEVARDLGSGAGAGCVSDFNDHVKLAFSPTLHNAAEHSLRGRREGRGQGGGRG